MAAIIRHTVKFDSIAILIGAGPDLPTSLLLQPCRPYHGIPSACRPNAAPSPLPAVAVPTNPTSIPCVCTMRGSSAVSRRTLAGITRNPHDLRSIDLLHPTGSEQSDEWLGSGLLRQGFQGFLSS